jgi:DNA-binding transcriptional regulator YiaG
MALARRGMTLLRAKRAIEAMLDEGEVAVEAPTVEDFAALVRDLRKAGVDAARIATDPVDVRSLRLRLGLSQEQFARRFNLDLDALQNWEQGRRSPERAVWSYLRVIAAHPEAAARAQEEVSRPSVADRQGFAEEPSHPPQPKAATRRAVQRRRP